MECFGVFSLLNIAYLPLGLCKYDHSGVVECYLVKFLPASIAVCASMINRVSVEIVCLVTCITHISLDVGRLAIFGSESTIVFFAWCTWRPTEKDLYSCASWLTTEYGRQQVDLEY